ncbi:hypothetical protein GALL_457200 [mine drainage metagenome]|uniref:Uncharacterized protein n=1 Tax=mine drainage metagenome TaxID=410659 RepID=A0A1J5PYK4_9ZZZZ
MTINRIRAMAFANMIAPYFEANPWIDPTRIQPLTTPVSANATTHQIARTLNLGTAIASDSLDLRIATRANTPLTHNALAMI